MSSYLQQYLFDVYKSQHIFTLPNKRLKNEPIQIDDQDDNDPITDFCNIFCSVGPKNVITLEFYGRFPITKELTDIIEIYGGFADPSAGKMIVKFSPDQIEVLRDISDKLRKTSLMGDLVNNPSWLTVSARTISSLYRFMRIIKEYKQSRP
ncbi:MAG: hypothetical protein ABSF80_06855 [Chitinispirillaceae bacterium]|jgi:phage/plasmid-associated DNA primase